jgi:hypothetical protein
MLKHSFPLFPSSTLAILCFSFQFLGLGWDWVHFVHRPLTGLLYEPRMIDDECGAVGGMIIGRGNRSIRRKSAPVSLWPPQIPHDLTWARTRPAAVGSLSYGTALWLLVYYVGYRGPEDSIDYSWFVRIQLCAFIMHNYMEQSRWRTIVAQQVNKFPAFMNPGELFQCLQRLRAN